MAIEVILRYLYRLHMQLSLGLKFLSRIRLSDTELREGLPVRNVASEGNYVEFI